MQRVKNLIEQQNRFTKLARNYTAKRDYFMANYYFDRLDYVEKELDNERMKKVKERKQERNFKEKNNESN